MDGFQVVEYIKNDPELVNVIIMMLTSDNRSGDVTRAKELGLSAYLVKPVRRANLLEIIRSVTVINDTKQNVNALPVHSTLAHKLKGIGGGFGFGLITDIGKSLEASSKNNNRSAIEKWLNELSRYLEKVEVVYV